MKKMRLVLAGVVLILGLVLANAVHAQLTDADALSLVETTTPTPAVDVPEAGTFYSAQNSESAPSPADVIHVPAWNLGGGFWLLDDLDYDYTQTESTMTRRGLSLMDDLGGDDLTPTFSFPTNGLWLQITNVADGLAYVNLMNATDSVYEIWSKTDLSLTNWTIEAEVWPTNTSCMPFIVPELDRTNLFIWARDWTGVDENSNGLPDWWEWKYFGNLNQSATNDYDGDGVDNYDEYLDDNDPNKIGFFLQFTNDYVNTSTASGTVAVFGGVPSYIAVLVDDTNYAGASWTAYTSSNITAYLGLTEGWHNVTVGSKGRPDDAAQSWQGTRLKLDTIPPVIIITNPVAGTVSQPMIQVQGLVNEQLSSLTFDVSNTTGFWPDQTGYTTEVFYDTNTLEFTTNSFQCYDVPLTNGVNIISIHATDLAGNVTTTNLAVTLDYSGDTTPPVVQLVWPNNGTLISGSNFNLQAQVDDATAKVTAAIVDSSGNTNSVPVTVERDGSIRAENLPLATGTNNVMLTATDAAGNVSTTNFPVMQSTISVAMNPLSSDQLNGFFVSVNGTVSDASRTVTVNGITATVDSGGNWSADNVPVSPSGRAEFNVAVTDGSGNLLASQSATTEQPVTVDALSQQFSRGFEPYVYSSTCGITISGLETEQWVSGVGGVFTLADVGATPDCLPNYANETDELTGDDDYENVYFEDDVFTHVWENAETRYPSASSDPPNFLFNRIQTRVAVEPGGGPVTGKTQAYLVFVQAFEPEDPNSNHRQPLPPEWLAINGHTLVSTGMTNEDDLSYFKGAVWGVTVVQGPAGVPVAATPVATQVFDNFNDVYSGAYASNLDLQSLTVVSNSATQIDATNWAVVKSPVNDYVIVQAKLSITNDWFVTNATLLAEAGAAIQWTGGEAMPGNPLQRRVTKTNSVETTVTATLGGTNASLNVWVIWATINYATSGENPSPLTFPPIKPGGNLLGLQVDSGGDYACGKICVIATITPAGAHTIVSNDWDFIQMRLTHDYQEGTSGALTSTTWTNDGPFVPYKTIVLNGDDKLYSIDAPNIQNLAPLDSYEIYSDFYNYVEWNSQICSDTNNFWYFEARWKSGQSPQITYTNFGIGTITLPTNAFYPPP